MDEQTRKLLEECSIGCEMGADSMKQIHSYIKDSRLRELTERYIQKHEDLRSEAVSLLTDSGNEPRDPGVISSAFSWFTTGMKLTFNDDNTQIAKLLIDGCSMGIKTLGERMNTLNEADKKARELAQAVIKSEEDLMKELQKFL